VRAAGAGAVGATLKAPLAAGQSPAVARKADFDVAVVGAGVFGSWIAYQLQRGGRRVALIDAYGPGNARSSSGGQTRVIRMGYGDKEIYTRWSLRSLELWKRLFQEAGRPGQFQPAGVLWMARERDPLTTTTLETLERLRVRHERLERAELQARWPQIDPGPITWAIHEPDSGFLQAFRAVQTVAHRAIALGAVFLQERMLPIAGHGELASVATASGKSISARTFVLACGPWLPKLVPDLLADRIFPTRQEVLYFGVPPGDVRFQSPSMPVWVDFAEEIYGLPDFEGRGFKVAPDRHGPPADPDSLERLPSGETVARVREFVGRRFPALRDAPVVASEVCQYENTSNGDFLIDVHPGLSNVWLVGGGSGHGFKHGPALGEYVAERMADGKPVDARFGLASKQKAQDRTVF
jgi:monomeric sarcosine oxidase